MDKTRIIARITAGAVASAVLLTGALFASPAQAKDAGTSSTSTTTQSVKDTGWGTI